MSGILSLLLVGALLADASLIDAVKQRNVTAVKALLQKRVDVNAAEGDGATALHWAVYRDDAQLVDLLIKAGAKVNAVNDLNITPLYLAGANGNGAIVERLLKAGANPEAASEAGVTPLMEAARSGSVAAVHTLISHEANVNAKENDRQQTALMWAVSQKHPDVVKLLLEHGADIHPKTRVRDVTVVTSSAPRIKASKDGAFPIEVGGSTALLFAALSGDVECAKLLLAAGANPNDTASDRNSALILATFNGNGPVARVLLEAGADPNAAGAGYTALHAAALRGDTVTAQALLAKGANPDARLVKGSPVRRFGSQWALPGTIAGATPLFVAAMYVEVDIVRELLAHGANPTLFIENGTTPLLAAAGIAVERLARPSDLVRWNVMDSDTPAIPRDEQEVLASVRLLLDAGGDVNRTNAAGDNALHAAAANSSTTLIQLLVNRGAILEAKNKQGLTPLAMTMANAAGGTRRPQPQGGAETQARAKAAEDLLRKLGALQ
jgi:ankyrin repeat protein